MTDKIRILLEDVQTVYEGKGMVVHPNSFDRLKTEIIKLDNINKQMKCNTSNIANEILDNWCRNKDDYCPHLRKLEKENAGIKNFIIKNKKVCKELAEEYRQRYNKDKDNRLALNMFYHNVIAFNSFEDILAEIENRNSEIMCFSSPPILTEETVEVNLKQIAELKKENAELKEELKDADEKVVHLACNQNKDLKRKLTKATEIIKMWLQWANDDIDSPKFQEIVDKSEAFIME